MPTTANPLRNLAASLGRREVLTPELKRFLLAQHAKPRDSVFVIEDARLTIATFRERIKAYSHGRQAEGELFHPSALGNCLRALWYSEMKAPKSGAPSGDDLIKRHVTFEFGTYAHVMFQNLCEQAGVLEQREIGIKDVKRKILGHADGIVKIHGKRYLLEIKTSNSRNFIALTAIKEAHKRQVHAYMKCLGLTSCVTIYLNKDTSQTREFVVDFDQAYYDEFVDKRITTYFKAVKTRQAPPREGSNPSLFPCSYCDFQKVCYDSQVSDKFLKSLKK